MTLIRILIIAIAVVCHAQNSYSQSVGNEPINGAFGMKLGDVFDPQSAIAQGSLKSGTPMYQFSPDNPFRSLSEYHVLITPKTHKIYAIWGSGKFSERAAAEQEQLVLLDLLSKKYGKVKEPDTFSGSMRNAKSIDQGNRAIVTLVDGFIDGSLEVRYIDVSLSSLADKELLEIESSKADASGL